jgi:cytochrome b subunit of formate dehydrogenase
MLRPKWHGSAQPYGAHFYVIKLCAFWLLLHYNTVVTFFSFLHVYLIFVWVNLTSLPAAVLETDA